MMEYRKDQFRTRVDVRPLHRPVDVTDTTLFLGSCFAQRVGGRFVDAELRARVNPLGVLYNPASIGRVLFAATHPDHRLVPVLQRDGQWTSWLCDSTILCETEDACRQRVMQELDRMGQSLRTLDHLVITLGTSRCYSLVGSGEVVSNCHKQPDRLFRIIDLDVEACVEALAGPLSIVLSQNPSMQVILTVSPYRYAKYGYHGNQLSKATLLLATDRLCSMFPGRCLYFPAYEIVMDELRDYRFYAEDMLHPSSVAVDYIWERFVEAGFTEQAKAYLQEWDPISRALNHRLLDPDTEAAQTFIQRTQQQRATLRAKYGLSD